MGRVEWASLHFEIIKALAHNLDAAQDDKLQMARLNPNSKPSPFPNIRG